MQGIIICGLDLFHGLLEGHGQRISFISGRAARRPGPERLTGLSVFHERRDDRLPQMFPGRLVAEKAGHANQEFLKEKLHFLGILLQIANVICDPVDLMNTHAPFDPAVNGVFFVQGEIVARLRPKQDKDFFQGALVIFV